ncbi:MAG: hypothetical protein HDT48_08125 [Ruminococcaceae bacterium]|nr:hypothetical protein [Oscillospiraceae bacterium]
MTDERIINAVDSIEPDADARQRMYGNILKKAQTKAKTVNTLRIVKTLASAAACVCLVIAAAVFFRFGAADFENTASGGADMNGYAEAMYEANLNDDNADVAQDAVNIDAFTAAPEMEFEETAMAAAEEYDGMEAALEEANAVPREDKNIWDDYEGNIDGEYVITFVLPQGAVHYDNSDVGAANVTYKSLSTDFDYNGHIYTLSASKEDYESSGPVGEIIEYDEIDSETNAVIYSIDSGDTVRFQARWSNGTYSYLLCSTDEVEKEDFLAVSAEVIENNRY